MMKPLAITAFLSFVILGGRIDLFPTGHKSITEVNQAPNGVYTLNGYVYPNEFGFSITEPGGDATSAYGKCNNCEGYGQVKLNKTGVEYTILGFTPIDRVEHDYIIVNGPSGLDNEVTVYTDGQYKTIHLSNQYITTHQRVRLINNVWTSY